MALNLISGQLELLKDCNYAQLPKLQLANDKEQFEESEEKIVHTASCLARLEMKLDYFMEMMARKSVFRDAGMQTVDEEIVVVDRQTQTDALETRCKRQLLPFEELEALAKECPGDDQESDNKMFITKRFKL